MKTKLLLLSFFAIIGKTNFGQTLVSAEVVMVVNQGVYDYAVISEVGTNNVYQTSAYYSSQGYLISNQQIDISFTDINDKTQGEIIASTISNVYCYLNSTSTNSNMTINYPILSNDILFFDDRDHVNDFHDCLEGLIDNSSLEEFDLLDSIETGVNGYQSFRTAFETEHNLRAGSFTSQALEEIIESDFVIDEIMKTMLNHNRMIGIGDSVFCWYGENIILGMDANKQNAIASVVNLPDTLGVYELNGVIGLLGNGQDIHVFSPFFEDIPESTGVVIKVDDDLYYETVPELLNFQCETYIKGLNVKIREIDTDIGYNINYDMDAVGSLTIDWGDGSPIQVINDYNHQIILHAYASTGNFQPKTTLVFYDRNLDEQVGIDETPETIGEFNIREICSEYDKSTVKYPTVGSKRMVAQLFVYHNVIGRQVGARTSYYENNGGGWSNEKSDDMYAKVNASFRDYSFCMVMEEKEESKFRRRRRDVQADKSKMFQPYSLSDGDVYSVHYIDEGGLRISIGLVLNPCE